MIRAVLVSLLALAACNPGQCEQHDLKDMSPKTAMNLNDIDLGDYRRGMYEDGSLLAVGDAGVIVTAAVGYAPLQVATADAGDLRAALLGPNDRAYVAGDGGALLTAPFGADTWQPVATGTTADLYQLAWIDVQDDLTQAPREYQLAVGDEVVLLRDPVDDSWDLLPPPPGGWGRLRAVVGDDRVHVAGLGGVIWSAADPRGTWQREDAGTTADLLAGDFGWNAAVLVGARGTLLHRPGDRWERVPSTIEADLIALAWVTALGADGRVYDLVLLDEPQLEAWTAPWARSLADGERRVIVGDGGRMARIPGYCD